MNAATWCVVAISVPLLIVLVFVTAMEMYWDRSARSPKWANPTFEAIELGGAVDGSNFVGFVWQQGPCHWSWKISYARPTLSLSDGCYTGDTGDHDTYSRTRAMRNARRWVEREALRIQYDVAKKANWDQVRDELCRRARRDA